MQDLRAWLENLDALCGRVLREPTSGFHKMNLASALSRSKRALAVPSGRGRHIDQLVYDLAETADTVRRLMWDARYTLSDQYLETLSSLIEELRSEVAALIEEIPLPDPSLPAHAPVEPIAKSSSVAGHAPNRAGSIRIPGMASLRTGISALGKVVRRT